MSTVGPLRRVWSAICGHFKSLTLFIGTLLYDRDGGLVKFYRECYGEYMEEQWLGPRALSFSFGPFPHEFMLSTLG